MNTKHLGKQLAEHLEDQGKSKKRVAKLLGICYNTLMARIKDGNFREYQVEKLKEKGYISSKD